MAESCPYCHNKLIVLKQEKSRLKLLNSFWECSGPASKDSFNAQSEHTMHASPGLGQAKRSLCLVCLKASERLTSQGHLTQEMPSVLSFWFIFHCAEDAASPTHLHPPRLPSLPVSPSSVSLSLSLSISLSCDHTQGHRQFLSTLGPGLLQLELFLAVMGRGVLVPFLRL